MAFNPNEKVTAEVVARLLETGEPESQVLDYKRELPVKDEDVRHDFLEDVAAFANTAGGVILFGIETKRDDKGQDTGIPEKVVGLAGVNLDKAVQRLEAKLSQLVKPRIPGVVLEQVADAPGGPVLAVRVPRSWASPHLIHKPGAPKWVCFYTRKSSGNQHLDWQEIRSAFSAGEGHRERIERFINDRVGKIGSDAVGWPLDGPSRLILHVIPVGAVGGESVVDVESVYRSHALQPLGTNGDPRYIHEGVLSSAVSYKNGKCISYALLFREGMIESALCSLVRPAQDTESTPTLAIFYFEDFVIKALRTYQSLISQAGASPPVLLALSATGMRGVKFVLSDGYFQHQRGDSILHDVLTCSPVVFNSFDQPIEATLKPCFDALWNAAGLARSMSYDENGNFQRKPMP